MHYPREDVPDCSSLVKKITSLSSMLGALSVQGVEMRKSFHPTETDLQECFHHPSICFCSPGLEQHQSWERSGVRKEQASLLPSTSTLGSWLADPIQVRQSEDLGLVFKGKRITRSSIRSATVLEILTVHHLHMAMTEESCLEVRLWGPPMSCSWQGSHICFGPGNITLLPQWLSISLQPPCAAVTNYGSSLWQCFLPLWLLLAQDGEGHA